MTTADHFSECVESHAFETYDKFIRAKGSKFDRFLVVCLALLACSLHMYHLTQV